MAKVSDTKTGISFYEVENIFNTLPIGYYLGREIKCVLSKTSNASFFNPVSDNIVISYPMIQEASENFDRTDDLESVIRGLLYHEISHVIFTNPDLKTGCRREYLDIINIVEDERIETICRNVYMNVNFRRNIILLNNYKGQEPKDAFEAFYQLVRFHKGTEYWLNKLHNLISKHANLKSDDYPFGYQERIIDFYEEFMEEYEKNHEDGSTPDSDMEESSEGKSSDDSSNSSSSSMESSDNNANGSGDADESDDSDNSEGSSSKSDKNSDTTDESQDTSGVNSQGSESDSDSESSNTKSEEAEESKREKEVQALLGDIEEFDDIADNLDSKVFAAISKMIVNKYYDPALEVRLNNIITQKLKKQSQNGSAINAYSGRFNPRAVVREDYRWWNQQNRAGHVKQFSKVHFNLIIDNSGSFYRNDDNMNKFIKTLDRINDPDFSFDVITINTRVVEWENHNQLFESMGGNCLKPDIADVLRKHQKPQTNNYNIVLFDGDAHSDDFEHFAEEPFKKFDTANTILITDDGNKRYIDGKLHKATVRIINSGYCEVFIKTICDLLERVL